MKGAGDRAFLFGIFSMKTKKAIHKEDPMEQARKRVHASWPEIIEAVIKKAKAGSYLHARFLAEIAREDEGQAEMSDAALAKLMMDELK